MTDLEAIFLGIVQGLTEFLPVSSSGHLTLFQALFGYKDLEGYVAFDIVCHLGTLLAIFIVFHRAIWEALFKNWTRLGQVILGTLPLFPLVLLLKPIKSLFDRPELLGFFFLTTALLLYLGICFGQQHTKKNLENNKWRDAFTIGIFQAFAILPGVSRSGSTLSGARLLGWGVEDALTFSFLLAIPAILGGAAVEILQLYLTRAASVNQAIPLSAYFWGLFTSFIVGWGALLLLKYLAPKRSFMYFVWYCIGVGIFSLIYFNA